MNRKFAHALALLAMILALALVWGCSDDDDPAEPDGDDEFGTISGIVSEADGDPLADVTVTAGNRTTTTSEDGYFVLTGVPAGENVLGASKTAYMPTFRVAAVLDGGSLYYGDLVLVPVEEGTVNGATGGGVETDNGLHAVEFAANGFVDGAGDPYTGEVTVQLNALVPSDDGFYGAFPGEFAGVREDDSVVPFVSYGFMTVEIAGEDKAPLELAAGVTATLHLTIDELKAASAPATIPMWYFDESDGVWREEGEATLVGNVYTASVSHFTTWNWDLPVEDICSITGYVLNEDDVPIAGARVVSQGVDWAIMDETLTNAAGAFTVRAVRNAVTDVWAVKGSLASDATRVTVGEVCPFVLETALVLTVPAYSISLTWGVEPSDLDSHLLIPMTWDVNYDYYHLYYSSMGSYGEDPYAVLDTDDTSSYGPEIITGTHLYEGRFQYWVNNWTGDTSSGIATSGAVVLLEVGGVLRLYEAADVTLEGADQTGWWHVFDLVVVGGDVTVESIMEYQPVFSYEGVYEDKAMPAKQK